VPGKLIKRVQFRSAGCPISQEIQRRLEEKSSELGFELEVRGGSDKPVIIVGDFEFSQDSARIREQFMSSLGRFRHLFPKGGN